MTRDIPFINPIFIKSDNVRHIQLPKDKFIILFLRQCSSLWFVCILKCNKVYCNKILMNVYYLFYSKKLLITKMIKSFNTFFLLFQTKESDRHAITSFYFVVNIIIVLDMFLNIHRKLYPLSLTINIVSFSLMSYNLHETIQIFLEKS